MNWKVLTSITLLLIGIIFFSCASEDQIKRELLKKTPVGSSIAQMMELCGNKSWKCNYSDTAGYLDQRTGKTVGVKSVWGLLSEYKTTPLTIVSVEAYWGFDKYGNLIDIWVGKTTDAP